MSHPTIIIIGMPNCCLCPYAGAYLPSCTQPPPYTSSFNAISGVASARICECVTRTATLQWRRSYIYAAEYDFRVNSAYNNPGCCVGQWFSGVLHDILNSGPFFIGTAENIATINFISELETIYKAAGITSRFDAPPANLLLQTDNYISKTMYRKITSYKNKRTYKNI